jgi:hypothetical protein
MRCSTTNDYSSANDAAQPLHFHCPSEPLGWITNRAAVPFQKQIAEPVASTPIRHISRFHQISDYFYCSVEYIIAD